MKSHEVLKQVVEGVGTKQVAHDMRVSTSLVYKWCADSSADSKRETSGARNPLDRILHLVEATSDPTPIIWLCEQVGGHFVQDPDIPNEELDAECIRHTQVLLEKFTNLLQVISESIANESRIDEDESRDIRTNWRELQRQAETFVRGCERGTFDPTR